MAKLYVFAYVTAATQNTQTATSGTTMEEFSTTTTLNQQTSTTDSDSTTLIDELTTVTGLQTPTGMSRTAFVLAWNTISEEGPLSWQKT